MDHEVPLRRGDAFPRERLPCDGAQPQALSWGLPVPARDCERAASHGWSAAPVISGKTRTGKALPIFNPASTSEEIGSFIAADAAAVDAAIGEAVRAQPDWDAAGGEGRQT